MSLLKNAMTLAEWHLGRVREGDQRYVLFIVLLCPKGLRGDVVEARERWFTSTGN